MAAPGLSCSMWDLVSWPGIKPGPPALGAQSLNHWASKEVPYREVLKGSGMLLHWHRTFLARGWWDTQQSQGGWLSPRKGLQCGWGEGKEIALRLTWQYASGLKVLLINEMGQLIQIPWVLWFCHFDLYLFCKDLSFLFFPEKPNASSSNSLLNMKYFRDHFDCKFLCFFIKLKSCEIRRGREGSKVQQWSWQATCFHKISLKQCS